MNNNSFFFVVVALRHFGEGGADREEEWGGGGGPSGTLLGKGMLGSASSRGLGTLRSAVCSHCCQEQCIHFVKLSHFLCWPQLALSCP